MATERATKGFARRWNEEIWGQQNTDIIDELVHEDFVGYDPSRPEPVRGPEGVHEVVEMLFSAFPDTQVDLEEVVAEGDLVAFEGTMTGTHEGVFRGIDPTLETIDIPGNAMHRVRDGKIAETWATWNSLGALGQLGVTELPRR